MKTHVLNKINDLRKHMSFLILDIHGRYMEIFLKEILKSKLSLESSWLQSLTR